MRRVCFFGAWDAGYPRNRILRDGLRRAGAEVLEVRVAEHRAFRRMPALTAAWLRGGRDADAVLVPSFRHKDVPLAKALAGRRPLLFDPLVSRYDTLVGDWGLHAPGSAQARWNRHLDRWSMGLPDRVLCDTWAHGAYFEELGVPRARLRRLLVGAEDAFFAAGEPPPEPPVRVVYLGGFLPLHGMPVVIEACARLERERARLPDFEIELVGAGQEFERTRALAARARLERVVFTGRVDYREAPRVMREAHVVLGAFGAGAKAGRVIPHKVWQGLASGRAVLTGLGPGLLEVFTPGEHLEAVPRGDAGALADALARLIADPAARRALGTLGRARARELGTPEVLGRELSGMVEEVLAS